MRSATRLIRSASATDEPPYFCTTRLTRLPFESSAESPRYRAQSTGKPRSVSTSDQLWPVGRGDGFAPRVTDAQDQRVRSPPSLTLAVRHSTSGAVTRRPGPLTRRAGAVLDVRATHPATRSLTAAAPSLDVRRALDSTSQGDVTSTSGAVTRRAQALAANAASRMSRPSCSRSSPITSGGRKRSTLPYVPAVSVISPCWWQAAETAAGQRRVRACFVPGLDQFDGEHRAAPADVADRRRTCSASALESRAHRLLDPPGRAGQVLGRIVSIAPSAAAQATGLPPYVPPRPPTCTASMISARPVTAASGRPPAMPLAVVIRSGTTPSCSQANQSPVRQKPVWISSAMNRMPLLGAPVGDPRAGSRAPGR